MSHKEETYLNGVFSVYPIVISEFLECHSKAQSTSLFMSVAMNQLLRVVQRAVHGKLRSDFQRVIGDRVVELCAGRAAPPPPTICGRRRRRLLLIGAPPPPPPPPIICRRAADTIVAA